MLSHPQDIEVVLPFDNVVKLDSHGVHWTTPDTSEYVPTGQYEQVKFDVAPDTFEYVPTGHFVHSLTPKYVPG